MYYVYEIKNKITNHAYVGLTTIIPASRWAQHISLLQRKEHYNQIFQAVWNQSKLTDWIFSILEEFEALSVVEAKRKESLHLSQIEKHLLLNFPKKETKTQQVFDEVLRRISIGEKYIKISQELGIAIGTISNIKNRRLTN